MDGVGGYALALLGPSLCPAWRAGAEIRRTASPALLAVLSVLAAPISTAALKTLV